MWTSQVTNGHLPHHMAWVAYRHQLWPGLQYGLGTMTNDIEEAESALQESDYKMLNILGVACTVTKGLRKLHTTFGGFGLFSLPTEQLICRINMLLQHYHMSTSLSWKLDASLRYLQLQLGMPHNPLTLDYDKWGHLAPVSWVKMLWVMEIASLLQYPLAHGEPTNPASQGEGSGSHANIVRKEP
jgi:hypothetical protein